MRISASLIRDFLACEEMANFRLNNPQAGKPSIESVVGTVVHDVICKHPEEDLDKMVNMANSLYEDLCFENNLIISDADLFGDDGYATVPEIGLKRIKRCLSNYTRNFFHFAGGFYHQEFRFYTDIQVSKFKKLDLVGIMDSVDFLNDIIIDWKTGDGVPKTLSNDVQFILYNYAYKKLFKRTPRLYYVSLASGKAVEYEHIQDFEDELIKKIIPHAYRRIEGRVFNKNGIFTKTCQYCHFAETCLGEI